LNSESSISQNLPTQEPQIQEQTGEQGLKNFLSKMNPNKISLENLIEFQELFGAKTFFDFYYDFEYVESVRAISSRQDIMKDFIKHYYTNKFGSEVAIKISEKVCGQTSRVHL
jgi:hypothetical protein